MKISDVGWGLLLSALSIALLVSGSRYGHIVGQSVGAGTFPMVLGVALAGCSIHLIVRGWPKRSSWIELAPWVRSFPHASSFVVVILALSFLALTMDRFGYHLSITIAMVAMMLKLGNRPGHAIGVALIAAIVTHVLFYKLLRVPLPWGILPALY